MGDAQRGDDAIYFFAASLGLTRRLVVTDIPAQLPDEDGALVPGRYLLHIAELSANAKQITWVRTGKFGTTVPVAADVPAFPMSLASIMAVELNVRKGANDQIAAVNDLLGTTTNLYITQISRGS